MSTVKYFTLVQRDRYPYAIGSNVLDQQIKLGRVHLREDAGVRVVLKVRVLHTRGSALPLR
jgi:hypothetical protein